MTPTQPEPHEPESRADKPHGVVCDDELGPEFWAAELALFNEFCLDDPLPEDPDEADAADHKYQEWLDSHRQSDGSLPLTEELHEQVESAYFDAVSTAIDVLAANLTDHEPPKAGTPLFGTPICSTETPQVYSSSDRVRDLAERIVAIDQAERVLAAAKTKLYAQIPNSFVPDVPSTAVSSSGASHTAIQSEHKLHPATGSNDDRPKASTGEPTIDPPSGKEHPQIHADAQGMGILSAANLIAVKTRTSDLTIKEHINYAYTITESLPEVLSALENGVINFAHALEIAKASSAVPEKYLHKFSREAINLASSHTPGRLRRQLQKLVAAVSPECQSEQSKQAYHERRVWVEEYENGMAMLGAILPAPLAIAAANRITQIAKHTMRDMPSEPQGAVFGEPNTYSTTKTESGTHPVTDGATSWVKDSRTLNQARADVFAELLLSSTGQRPNPQTGYPFGLGIDAKIQLSVPVSVFTPKSTGSASKDRRYGPDKPDAPGVIGTTAKPGTAGIRDTSINPDNSTNPDSTAVPDSTADPNITASPIVDSKQVPRTDVAELHGYGLIDPEISRQFALDANSWDRIFISDSHQVIGTDNYVPTAAIKRFLWARDQHCRFPGCLEFPSRCEIDHTFDWAKGGRTSTENLALLCKRHHALKHPSVHKTSRWEVTQLAGGVLEWKSPDGQLFVDLPDPPPTVALTPQVLTDPREVAELKESIAAAQASAATLPPNTSHLVTSQKKYKRVVAFEEVTEEPPPTPNGSQTGLTPRKRLRPVTAEFDVEPIPPHQVTTPWALHQTETGIGTKITVPSNLAAECDSKKCQTLMSG